jgi:hypothetical protein
MGVALLPDWQGTGQAREETGEGIVTQVEPGARNAHVKIRATHTNLTELVTGWLDTQAGDLPAEGAHVAYRIVVHRKRSVDPALPLDDVARRERVRDLVEWHPAGNGHPAANGKPAAEATRTAPGAPEPPSAPADEPGPGSGAPLAVVLEAVRAAEGILRPNRPDAAPAAVRWMAEHLIRIADEIELAPDPLTAIQAVSAALAAAPYPFEGDRGDRDAWRTRLRDHANTLVALAQELTEGA